MLYLQMVTISHSLHYAMFKSVSWLAAGFEDKTAYAQCIFAYTPGTSCHCLILSGFSNKLKKHDLYCTSANGSVSFSEGMT